MRKAIYALLFMVIFSGLSVSTEAKVPIRFPFKLAPGISQDTVISIMEQRGFTVIDQMIDSNDVSWCSFEGDASLSKNIPVVNARMSFLSGHLYLISLGMPYVSDEVQQLVRLKEIGQFIKNTYFINTNDVQIENIRIERLKGLGLEFEGSRIKLRVSSHYDANYGYGIFINYQDKWAEDKFERRMIR